MAEARIFGAIRGAGTQVNEEAGQEELIQGKLGSTVLIGVFERGLEGDLTITQGRRTFDRKMGGLLDPEDFNTPGFASLHAPLMAQHFWKQGKGAGILGCLRVVPRTNNATQDDRPTKSIVKIFNRETQPKTIGYLTAHNGGSWGGKRRTFIGALEGVPGNDFPSSNQIQLYNLTAKTLQVDELKNCTVTLDGLPGNSYRVVSNTALGLLTLEADQDVQGDWGSGQTYGNEDSDAETFDISTVATPRTLGVTTETGGPDTATITTAPASVGGDGAPSTPVAAGDVVFDVTQDGVTKQYTIAFNGEASLAAILATINSNLPGCQAEDAGTGECIVYTDQEGTGAAIVINDAASTAGTVADVFSTATPTETAGSGDVVNFFKVTAAELKTDLDTAIGGGASAAVTSVSGGVLNVRSSVSGSGGYVTMSGSLITVLGFDGLQHDGTDGPSDLQVNIVRTNLNQRGFTKAIDVQWLDGGLRPDTEFGLIARIDGKKVLNYENLSMETNSSNYWADVINEDPNNDVFTVTDTFTGNRAAATARPANHYGTSDALTAQILTIADPFLRDSTIGGDWVPDFVWNSWGASCFPQTLKIVMTNATTYTLTTDCGASLNAHVVRNSLTAQDIGKFSFTGTIGVALDMGEHIGSITVNTTSGTPQAADQFFVDLKPLATDELVGGKVRPNTTKAQAFAIIDNTVSTVTVSDLNDLTDGGTNSAGNEYRLDYPQQMEQGYDGYVAGIVTSDYESLLDEVTSPLKKIKTLQWGQVKMAAPGTSYYTSGVSLMQKMRILASKYNWMAKMEIPNTYNDPDVYFEEDLVEWVNSTLLRIDESDYTSIHMPSYGYVRDPLAESESEARLVLVPTLGAILGEEARVAVEMKNHHKAPAGVDSKLPDFVKLPWVGKPNAPNQLDHEILNPAGINILKWKNNQVILWGDKTLTLRTPFRFMHKRNLMSQYENDILEGMDFTIFDINDPISDSDVLVVFHDYFLPEWRKRAIRGNSFVGGQNPAAIFKMDAENNTDATRAAGDQIIEISLRLADTTERLRIFIGPMGVSEAIE